MACIHDSSVIEVNIEGIGGSSFQCGEAGGAPGFTTIEGPIEAGTYDLSVGLSHDTAYSVDVFVK